MTDPQHNQSVLRAKRRALIAKLQHEEDTPTIRTSRSSHDAPETGRYMRRLKRALQRLDDGTYGFCMQCGAQISDARLHSDPLTTLCKTCKGVG